MKARRPRDFEHPFDGVRILYIEYADKARDLRPWQWGTSGAYLGQEKREKGYGEVKLNKNRWEMADFERGCDPFQNQIVRIWRAVRLAVMRSGV